VQVAEKFVNLKVDAVVGGFCSGAAIPMLPVLERGGSIPFLACLSSNPKLTEQGFKNIFRVGARDDWEGPIDAQYMYEMLGARKLATIHDNTTFGKGMAEFARDAFIKMPGASDVYFDAITTGAKDFTAVLAKVATTHPDVLFFSGYYADYATLLNAYAKQAYPFKIVGQSTVPTADLPNLAGPVLLNPNVTEMAFPWAAKLLGQGQFTDAFVAMFGTKPGPWAPMEYESMMVYAAAVEQAKTADAAEIVRVLHDPSFSYEGMSGRVSFDEKGDRKVAPNMFAVVYNAAGDVVPIASWSDGVWRAME
jgi:ABC-type branched-subunit amino acid transport system substrate-binding protein